MILKRRLKLLFLIYFFCTVFTLADDHLTTKTTPKIGLVLSGGGARGLAHIGVLKALEELKIPIDYMAGTSMGAVVGGLYASGMSTEEMETIVLKTDWEDMLRDRPSRRRLPYRRKVDELSFLMDFEVGLNSWNFQLPSGLISGQKLQFFLQTKLLPVTFIKNYLELPIPFFAVATDLETGGMVVMKKGNLARSIRASMSVPGVFTPVKIGNRFLVDGGLRSNLPVEVVEDMGADIVIAVNVSSPLAEREDLDSMHNITKQMIDMLLEQNIERSKKKTNILIEPNLAGLSSGKFEKIEELISIGYNDTMAMVEQLGSLADHTYDERRENRPKPEFIDKPLLYVQIAQDSELDPNMILNKLSTKNGDHLDIEKLSSDLSHLYEMGYFETVGFELIEEEDSYILIIDAFLKPWGPNTIRFGLNLESDFEGQGDFNLKANYTMTQLNRKDAQWKSSFQIGKLQQITSEFYQPLTFSDIPFIALTYEGLQFKENQITGENTLNEFQITSAQVGLDLGWSLRQFGEIRLGYFDVTAAATSNQMVLDIGSKGFKSSMIIDQLDNTNYPKNGYLFNIEYRNAKEKGSDVSDDQFERLTFGGLVSLTRRHHTIMWQYGAVTSLTKPLPMSQTLQAGGLFQVSGSGRNDFSGSYAMFSSAIYYYRIRSLPTQMGSGFYLGGSLDAGNAWATKDEVDFSDLHYGASLFVGADTKFGPLYLAYGINDLQQERFYLFMGRSF